ncbi:MAG: ankyrin repeat domain-containing protein [bacterium]
MKHFNKILLSSILIFSTHITSFAMKSHENKPFQQPYRHEDLAKKRVVIKGFIDALITATNQGNSETVISALASINFMQTEALANMRVDDREYGYHGWTLLQIAVEQGHEAVVRVLIKAGANPDEKVNAPGCYHHGWTALHIAAWWYKIFNSQKHGPIMQILIANNANTEIRIDNPSMEYHNWSTFDILCG